MNSGNLNTVLRSFRPNKPEQNLPDTVIRTCRAGQQALAMFSTKALKYMRKTVETVDFWGTLPFTWDKINNQIELSKAPGRKFIWYFHIFAQTAHFLFLLGRYIQFKYFVETATPSVKIYCEYAMLSYSIPVMFQLCILARLNEMTDFFHDFTQLFSRVQGEYVF